MRKNGISYSLSKFLCFFSFWRHNNSPFDMMIRCSVSKGHNVRAIVWIVNSTLLSCLIFFRNMWELWRLHFKAQSILYIGIKFKITIDAKPGPLNSRTRFIDTLHEAGFPLLVSAHNNLFQFVQIINGPVHRPFSKYATARYKSY